MFKKSIITSMVLTAALLNASGGSASRVQFPIPDDRDVDSSRLTGGSGEEVREEFHQTYPLSSNGRLSLENINGGVHIEVWDREEVKVDAVKRAYKRERLAEAQIDVSSAADGIRIKTIYPGRDQNFTDEAFTSPSTPSISSEPLMRSIDSSRALRGTVME